MLIHGRSRRARRKSFRAGGRPSDSDCEVAKSAVEPVSCWLRTATRDLHAGGSARVFDKMSPRRYDLLCSGQSSVPLAVRRPIILLGMTAVASMSLSACGRNGALELPPGPANIQPAPAALSWSPPGPVAADTSGAGPAGIQPAPAALSGPPAGPVAADASGAPPTQQDTIARTGFDVHGNPAATPGQKKPFFLDPLLQ